MARIDADVPGIDVFLDDGDMMPGDDLMPGGDMVFSSFAVLFVIVSLIIVGVVVLMIVLAVVNARRLRSKGISPLATNAEIMADAVRASSAQRPGAQPAGAAQTTEARLEEIEKLHAAGKITTAERDAARAKVLGTL